MQEISVCSSLWLRCWSAVFHLSKSQSLACLSCSETSGFSALWWASLSRNQVGPRLKFCFFIICCSLKAFSIYFLIFMCLKGLVSKHAIRFVWFIWKKMTAFYRVMACWMVHGCVWYCRHISSVTLSNPAPLWNEGALLYLCSSWWVSVSGELSRGKFPVRKLVLTAIFP